MSSTVCYISSEVHPDKVTSAQHRVKAAYEKALEDGKLNADRIFCDGTGFAELDSSKNRKF